MIQGYVCNFRRKVVRVWLKQPAGLTPKVAKIIPGSPAALGGMPPTDELPAGILGLSPTLVGSLREAVVAHVVGNTEDEGLYI